MAPSYIGWLVRKAAALVKGVTDAQRELIRQTTAAMTGRLEFEACLMSAVQLLLPHWSPNWYRESKFLPP
jgi:hypothetical protein